MEMLEVWRVRTLNWLTLRNAKHGVPLHASISASQSRTRFAAGDILWICVRRYRAIHARICFVSRSIIPDFILKELCRQISI